MSIEVNQALNELTPLQRTAADWTTGSLLVIAGPGSGKTRVLTTRIARILDESRDRSFRILALTFTNKAADEMASRVSALVPGLENRALIGTFHSFCMQILQQHGSHIGIKPDFAIYSHLDDRRELLKQGIKKRGIVVDDVDRYLPLIDKLKSTLIPPDDSAKRFKDANSGQLFSRVYAAYEEALLDANALDFSSLIERAHTLISRFPGIAISYRRIYNYWMLDEFQDTNDGQYRFLKALAGKDFSNIMAVADDDQIIYQWNGASYEQIQRYRSDFAPRELQLPTNYRCPPAIVLAANRLVVHNSQRTENKLPLEAGKSKMAYPPGEHIRLVAFSDENAEAEGIASEIRDLTESEWGGVVVLARTRKLIERVKGFLSQQAVPAFISQRRDEFLSVHFQWLCATLQQANRPLDQRNFEKLVSTFNRMMALTCKADILIAEATASTHSYVDQWMEVLQKDPNVSDSAKKLSVAAVDMSTDRSRFRNHIRTIIELFPQGADPESVGSDYAEDHSAWNDMCRGIDRSLGSNASLDMFLQELAIRSKEPPIDPNSVTLMTIHGSKGKEYDHVYLMGLAEDVLPSFQSVKQGETSAEMEEERRNCFVAVTRTKERLTISWAERYNGWPKARSRFVDEMGLEIN